MVFTWPTAAGALVGAPDPVGALCEAGGLYSLPDDGVVGADPGATGQYEMGGGGGGGGGGDGKVSGEGGGGGGGGGGGPGAPGGVWLPLGEGP